MTVQTFDVVDLSPEEMERSYLEYRRACYDIVYRNAVDRGVLKVLDKPVTLAQFAEKFHVVPDKVDVAGLLLKALVKHGAVKHDPDKDTYTAVAEPPTHELDIDLIRQATGRDSFEELRHSENYAGIIDALTTDANPVATTFDSDHLPVWEEVLQAPFYRYSRVQAVREIGGTGPHLLDLACGPGFGLGELAEFAPTDGTVFGVEISTDFVASATQRNAADERIRVTRGDVTQPLDFLQEGYFDGAMIVGAYHFLRNPEPLWDNVARLLRKGGTFCVSYVLSKVGTIDQEIMDLRFALRRPVSYQPTRQQVLDLAEAKGFELIREYGLGAWRWYSFSRK
ncbi:SAM-dependent methyltransferase [Kibdelosporangium banguiense]|uniref:SAM-dependent methyltransferase n=1 Tax=Kibdelosporangium banguiense TaxID=1365924 RepID=A0ABS4TTK0_9PSEU|nr:class I SAM-dependent methyltransferase [Kibdelosporangium banguiense]MBP2327305.1 SAM-dependent methyltransferase [Kibdelosporangium banguiense]